MTKLFDLLSFDISSKDQAYNLNINILYNLAHKMYLKTRNFLYTEDIFIIIYLLRKKLGKFCPKDIFFYFHSSLIPQSD